MVLYKTKGTKAMANAKVEDNDSQEASHPGGKIVLHCQPHPTFTIPAHVRLLKISPFEGGAGGGGWIFPRV